MRAERRSPTLRLWEAVNPQGEEPMPEAKPYAIPKQLVWDAYQRVKANRGAAGVDGESLAAFEKDLKNNLYKVWNRMSSGSYVPPPVRLVEIEKETGGTRPLGIPTVADRVAQTVVKLVLEPVVDPHFHPDSYGYRPGKSALDAVGMARKRCWDADWVIDLDIKAFFDSIPHDLVERAVAHHTDLPWVRLYIARWLRAPVQRPDGTQEAADERHAAGRCHQSAAGQSLPALHVRSVDAADVSEHSLRTVRGRCHRPLPERATGPCGVGSHSGSVRAVRSGASPDEDSDCLLQR